ncbi:MAG: DUF427 domain-containing protein [Desulfovibrionales bacterium]
MSTDPKRGPVAWSYPDSTPAFTAIKGFVSFYPAAVQCRVDGEPVRPSPEGFMGVGSPMRSSDRSKASPDTGMVTGRRWQGAETGEQSSISSRETA